MKQVVLFLVCVSSTFAAFTGTDGTVNAGAKTIEQYGVTWTFDKTPVSSSPNYATDYLYGQYANGDYWVYDEDGTVTVTAISPAKAENVAQVDQDSVTRYYTMDGSQVDPSGLGKGPTPTSTKQGFDSRATYFDDSVSVAAPVVLTATESAPATTLITAKSWRRTDEGCPAWWQSSGTMSDCPRPVLRYMAILTVPYAIPESDSFRPAYCGTTTKIVSHRTSQMDLSILPSVAKVGTAPQKATTFKTDGTISKNGWEDYAKRPWVQFVCAWSGCEATMTSESGNVGFGSSYGSAISNMCTLLMITPDTGTITTAERNTMAIRLIQVGIDTYGIIANGGGWGHIGGGVGQGRKLPILFAGVALDYAAYKAIGSTPEDSTHELFQEDCQKFEVLEDDITRWWDESKRVTRTNCSVSSDDRWLVTDDSSGNWRLADDGSSLTPYTNYVHYDYWLIWNYGTPAPEYVRITGVNYGSVGTNKMRLRDPVTPGSGRTARVVLFPRLGYPDWSGGSANDHYTSPSYDYAERSYRYAATGLSLQGIQLFALATPTRDSKGTIKSLWSWQPFFDYMDYYMITLQTEYGTLSSNRGSTWLQGMWDAYRPDYGTVWVEPTIGLIGDKNCFEGETVSFTVQDNDGYGTGTTDINGDSLSFSIDATSEGKGMTINASTGAFEWVTEEGDAGTHNVYFTVENDAGRKVYQGITITVEDGTPPTPAVDPVLAPVGNQSFLLSQAVEIDVVDATDENGGTLTYSASGLPSGMTINSSTGAFDGTPTSPGRFPVRIIVTDDTSRTDYEDIVIEIHNGTHPASFLKGS